MKPQSKYSEKLRDPRWQKKRLEVMNRDKFTCQICLDDKKTLNVHHLYYRRGCEPWDYDASELITLCQECHEFESENRAGAEAQLLEALKVRGVFSVAIEELAQSIASMTMPESTGETFHYLSDLISSPDRLAEVLHQQWELDPDVIAMKKAKREIDAESQKP